MALTHTLGIARPASEVFAFIADPRNDPQWCPRVTSCRQIAGDGPGVGARYEAVERPTLRPEQTRHIEVVEYEPDRLVVTRQEDLQGTFVITYRLEPTATGTRLTQEDQVDWKVPKIGIPIGKYIVGRHIPDQLSRLKRLLEQDGAGGDL
jgi:uncharacterized protein YndB with AHSA1/START domain